MIRTARCHGWRVILLSALAIGCNDIQRQRRLAEGGVAALREAFNNGECQEILDAADERFTRDPGHWLRECRELRKRLGVWRGFEAESSNNWPIGSVGTVWVEGRAVFSKGSYRVRTDWSLIDGRPRLQNFQLQGGGEIVSIPGFGPPKTSERK